MNYGKEIHNQLMHNRVVVWSWGAHAYKTFTENDFPEYGIHRGGLIFKVQGAKFKGHVMIVLTAADLYDVYFGHLRKGVFYKKLSSHLGIYCDQLHELIDTTVET